MAHVRIDTSRIVDWSSLHDVFIEAFELSDDYGRNLNSWIECMTAIDQPENPASSLHIQPGEVLTIELSDASDFALRCEDLYNAIVECSAFVNHHRLESGQTSVLALAYVRSSS